MNAARCVGNVFVLSNALKMNEQVQEKNGIDIMTLDRNERLKLAIKELSIGRRIREELRIQGRTVSWLARQLNMERTSLYHRLCFVGMCRVNGYEYYVYSFGGSGRCILFSRGGHHPHVRLWLS